jgi:hypothetical protein
MSFTPLRSPQLYMSSRRAVTKTATTSTAPDAPSSSCPFVVEGLAVHGERHTAPTIGLVDVILPVVSASESVVVEDVEAYDARCGPVIMHPLADTAAYQIPW